MPGSNLPQISLGVCMVSVNDLVSVKDYWGLVSLLFMGRIGRPIGVLYGETVSTVETAYSPLEVT